MICFTSEPDDDDDFESSTHYTDKMSELFEPIVDIDILENFIISNSRNLKKRKKILYKTRVLKIYKNYFKDKPRKITNKYEQLLLNRNQNSSRLIELKEQNLLKLQKTNLLNIKTITKKKKIKKQDKKLLYEAYGNRDFSRRRPDKTILFDSEEEERPE
jgi:hypothetical protein